MGNFFGVGLLAVDHIFLSTNDKKRPREYEYLGSSGGGTVSNILCMLSQLGHNTSVLGVTGNDIGRRIIIEDYKKFNVNYENVIKRGNRNEIKNTRQFTHKILQNGEHSFENECYECGIKFTRDYQMSKNDLNKKTYDTYKNHHLIMDRANNLTINLAKNIKNNHIIYDFGFNIYGRYNQNNKTLLKLCTILKTNEDVIKKFLNEEENLADRIINDYPNIEHLFITKGKEGVYGFSKINEAVVQFNLDSIPCTRVRDSGGAGDIFLATIVSELVNKNQIKSLSQLTKKINFSQSLASLNCTLYGARALQRFFLKEKFGYNEIKNIGNEIIKSGRVFNQFSPLIGLPDIITKPYRLSKLNSCDTCGNLTKERKKRVITKQNTRKKFNLHKSLVQAPWTMMSSFTIGKANREKIKKYLENGTIIIGSGGSFSSSVFAETLIFRSFNKVTKPMSPYEFESYEKLNSDLPVWFISHGGNNADILGSAIWAMDPLKIKHGLTILGNKNSKLANIALDNNWETILIPSKERNFVSVVGYLSQVALLCGMLAPEDSLSDLDRFFSESSLIPTFKYIDKKMLSLAVDITPNEQLFENLHLICLSRGWGWPALIDFESKIVEGGICTIEISELKNFTHGRYLNTFGAYNRNSRFVLMFSTPKDEEFVSFLTKKLRRYIRHGIIRTEYSGIIGSLELIIQSIFLAWYLGQIAEKNILKPKFPREARGLYGWEPSWRKNRWKNVTK